MATSLIQRPLGHRPCTRYVLQAQPSSVGACMHAAPPCTSACLLPAGLPMLHCTRCHSEGSLHVPVVVSVHTLHACVWPECACSLTCLWALLQLVSHHTLKNTGGGVAPPPRDHAQRGAASGGWRGCSIRGPTEAAGGTGCGVGNLAVQTNIRSTGGLATQHYRPQEHYRQAPVTGHYGLTPAQN